MSEAGWDGRVSERGDVIGYLNWVGYDEKRGGVGPGLVAWNDSAWWGGVVFLGWCGGWGEGSLGLDLCPDVEGMLSSERSGLLFSVFWCTFLLEAVRDKIASCAGGARRL